MIICKNVTKIYGHGGTDKKVLNNVSFTVQRGERIAVLGRNGAGKTTLIKMIGGVELPTSGTIRRNMTVSWPLGFAGGFQGSLTGYDNAKFIARIYQRDYGEMRRYIEDFTELGSQLRMPVKTYSSGMRARLAFGLSLAIEFDCYLIDEIILVGDQNFRRKSSDEFEKRKDRTMIIASHDTGFIRNFCNKAIILSNGDAEIHEDVNFALEKYSAM